MSAKKKAFRYSPTHDLKSLWWIAVFSIINKSAAEVPSKEHNSDLETSTNNQPDCLDDFRLTGSNTEGTRLFEVVFSAHDAKKEMTVSSSLSEAE
jgi:hypothetical protein